MANIKELRGRIKSISNIAKITKAMEMVASMKLRKVQQRALTPLFLLTPLVVLFFWSKPAISGG